MLKLTCKPRYFISLHNSMNEQKAAVHALDRRDDEGTE
jgi:hypothetical protein